MNADRSRPRKPRNSDTAIPDMVEADGIELDPTGLAAAAEVVLGRDHRLRVVNSATMADYSPESQAEFWDHAARVVAAYLKTADHDLR